MELSSNVVNANYNDQSDTVVLVTERGDAYYCLGKHLNKNKTECTGVPFGHVKNINEGATIHLSKSTNKKGGNESGCEW